ncbi:cell division protein FtsZ [bacterium]|nr:cell division protein FtsZ [bacterium]
MAKGNSLGVSISVIGVGGAGGNAVNMMVKDRGDENDESYSVFSDVKILAANTDAQDLEGSLAEQKIQLGPNLTEGKGAGGKPDVGRESAEESQVDIAQALEGTEMLFVTAGMGGGTGTGAAAIIASVARKNNILTVGVVTEPFKFEGRKKMKLAKAGIAELRENIDTLVVIPNEKLLEFASDDLGMREAFDLSNEVLLNAVKNIAQLISQNGYVNVDFADVRTTMTDMGVAMIGYGSATGENATLTAVQDALSNPLLSDLVIDGAEKALLYIGGMLPPMKQMAAAATYLEEKLHDDADFLWGTSSGDDSDKVYALVVASAKATNRSQRPVVLSNEKPVQEPLFQTPEISDIVDDLQSTVPLAAEDVTIEVEDDIEDMPLAPAAVKTSTSVAMNGARLKQYGNSEEDERIPSIYRQEKKNKY